jgi:hypothetical protein
VELDRNCSAGAQPVRAGVEQAPVRIEAVARREHRLSRLVRQVGEAPCIGRGEVGEVGDDEVDGSRHRVEQVAEADRDPVFEAVRGDVRACDGDRVLARVDRPDLCGRRRVRDGDRQRARAGADVDDPRSRAAGA